MLGACADERRELAWHQGAVLPRQERDRVLHSHLTVAILLLHPSVRHLQPLQLPHVQHSYETKKYLCARPRSGRRSPSIISIRGSLRD